MTMRRSINKKTGGLQSRLKKSRYTRHGGSGGATSSQQLQGSHGRTYWAEKRRDHTDVNLSEKTRFI